MPGGSSNGGSFYLEVIPQIRFLLGGHTTQPFHTVKVTLLASFYLEVTLVTLQGSAYEELTLQSHSLL